MNRAQRNHNPGNLRFAGQREAIGQDKDGFAQFADDIDGWQALVAQIELDQKRGDSIKKFIAEYAPKNENDTILYTRYVARGLNTNSNNSLSLFSPYAIAGLIARYEGYFNKDE